jgi:hypothetical protein
MEERMHAAREQIVQNARAKNWFNILQMFISVSYGSDAANTLMPIKMIDTRDINNL